MYNFPSLLPPSVKQTISTDAPSLSTITDYSSEWYTKYNSTPYNTSTFFKGPLLYSNIMTDNTELITSTTNSFKNRMKTHLLNDQCSGDTLEWNNNKFKLINLPGARSSKRIESISTVDYTE